MIGMACGLFMLLVVVIIVHIVVMSREGMSSKTDIMNSAGLTGVAGTIFIQQMGKDKSMITGRVTGLTEGSHGLHISTGAPTTAGDCTTAGVHYNPGSKDHAGPTVANRHVGDLGNIVANAQGFAPINIDSNMVFIDDRATSVMGKFFVVTAGADDLGLGGAADSLTTGNAGAAIACGTIKKGPPPPKKGKGGGPPGGGK